MYDLKACTRGKDGRNVNTNRDHEHMQQTVGHWPQLVNQCTRCHSRLNRFNSSPHSAAGP